MTNLLIQDDFICLFVYTKRKSCIFTLKTVVILICDFGAQRVKTQLGKQFFWIQNTQIKLMKVSKHFYPNMPTGHLFCGISTGLYIYISAGKNLILRRWWIVTAGWWLRRKSPTIIIIVKLGLDVAQSRLLSDYPPSSATVGKWRGAVNLENRQMHYCLLNSLCLAVTFVIFVWQLAMALKRMLTLVIFWSG